MMFPLILIIGGVIAYFYFYEGVVPAQKPTTTRFVPNIVDRGREFYVVKPGDWLSKIAPNFGMTMKQLLDLNPQFKPGGSRDPGRIEVGERIRVS